MSGSDKVDTKNQTSTGGKAGPVQGGANTADSGTFTGPSFDNLYLQKRSTDPQSVEKREKMAEMKPQQGILGKAFQNFVSGPGGPNAQ